MPSTRFSSPRVSQQCPTGRRIVGTLGAYQFRGAGDIHKITPATIYRKDVYLLSDELLIPSDAPNDLIRAAGGVVYRADDLGHIQLACIYRVARGDWTFPKGKLDEGETFEEAAVREVFEEIGHHCHIERFLGTTQYTHRKGKPKIVAYYLMAVNKGEFAPNEEVDELRWLPLEEVREHLTHERDQELFDLLVDLPEFRLRAS
jgi:8-oxo-dGTP diphosphatase